MTGTSVQTNHGIDRRKRYRILMYGSLAVGILGLVLGSFIEQYLAGVVVYWAGFFGMLGIWQLSPVTLFDERDQHIERKASDYTLSVFAFVLVLGGPGGIVLEQGEIFALPAVFDGAMWTLVAVYAMFGVIYTSLRIQG